MGNLWSSMSDRPIHIQISMGPATLAMCDTDMCIWDDALRKDWRYQRSNQKPSIQWPNEKIQNDKQRSTKHYTKN